MIALSYLTNLFKTKELIYIKYSEQFLFTKLSFGHHQNPWQDLNSKYIGNNILYIKNVQENGNTLGPWIPFDLKS